MSCFCRETFRELTQKLAETPVPPRKRDPVEPQQQEEPEEEAVPGQATAQRIDKWLTETNRLAPKLEPDPELAEEELPEIPPELATTVAALHNVATTLANVLGPEALKPGGQTPVARMVATLDQRMEEQEQQEKDQPNLEPWEDLARASSAARRILQAVAADAFDPEPDELVDEEEDEEDEDPAEKKLQKLVEQTRVLIPLARLLTPTTPIAHILRVTKPLRAARIPRIRPARLIRAVRMAQGINALAQLQQVIGADPVEAGYEEVREAVAEQVREAAKAYTESGAPRDPKALPKIRPRPEITRALVEKLQQVQPEELEEVPEPEPIRTLIPATSLAAALKRVMGRGVAARPCGRQCDARLALQQRQPPEPPPEDDVPIPSNFFE